MLSLAAAWSVSKAAEATQHHTQLTIWLVVPPDVGIPQVAPQGAKTILSSVEILLDITSEVELRALRSGRARLADRLSFCNG